MSYTRQKKATSVKSTTKKINHRDKYDRDFSDLAYDPYRGEYLCNMKDLGDLGKD